MIDRVLRNEGFTVCIIEGAVKISVGVGRGMHSVYAVYSLCHVFVIHRLDRL